MRIVLLIGLAATLAGCAADTSRSHRPHRPHRGGGPEHGRGQLFISPMGEPFRASQRPGAAQDLWFAGADADGDGRVTLAEFQRDATRFFAVLDRGKDGEIDPDDIAFYENVLVPEIRVTSGGRGGSPEGRGRSRGGPGGGGPGGGNRGGGSGGGGSGGQGMHFGDGDKKTTAAVHERLGAARFGFFDLPEPVIAADVNLNRGIDPAEFAKAATTRFAALDRNHDGALTRGELPRAGAETWRNGSDEPPAPPPPRSEP
ncbi:EF-hand domain-containing protein [Sphingomonas sp. CFBP 13603]|uniref:EF-hand domain-containing protein n=1 Tax=Sphingomonas sp. CFBP 13603 TaxID=2774040 RepID=UPI00186954C2|nr:EF-hand domain-containing protein [Sphingomonas sp. CFBP 13603]MBE2991083.1 EF-hand domain-containing protein [Sphingomonas sp. CFBP 13603]